MMDGSSEKDRFLKVQCMRCTSPSQHLVVPSISLVEQEHLWDEAWLHAVLLAFTTPAEALWESAFARNISLRRFKLSESFYGDLL